MAMARDTNRVILTFDHDYGDLVFRQRISCPGVILFRLSHLPDSEEPAKFVLRLLSAPGVIILGSYIVVSQQAVRIAPMPEADLWSDA